MSIAIKYIIATKSVDGITMGTTNDDVPTIKERINLSQVSS